MNDDRGDCPYKDQVFIHSIHAKDASGPMWARGLVSQDMERAYRDGSIKPQVDFYYYLNHLSFVRFSPILNEFCITGSLYVYRLSHEF